MKKATFLCLLLFWGTVLIAQQTITGTVLDSENSEPLIGANVQVLGTSIGTSTDVDGSFELEVAELPATLLFSYTGYAEKDFFLTDNNPVEIFMTPGMMVDEVVIIGSRGKPRTVLTSPVPVDNINAKDLLNSGQNNIDQMINFKVPSFNSTNQTISDATAHFDPSELRNLGPSRTLVLINGKRKNQSALVYVNDTPGKGEVGTDFKSIPTEAIERVEVLRDGAAAQYGSDAIAGVINIVMKENTDGFVQAGFGQTTEGDGSNYNIGINKGFTIGSNGNLNLTASYFHQDFTDRAGEPGRDDLFGVDGTNPWILENPDLGMRVGQPEFDKVSLSGNLNLPYNDGKGNFYSTLSYTNRNGESYALYRTPYWITDDFGLLTPSGEPYVGFQPTFETAINDYLFTFGNEYDINGWKTDMSLTTGGNDVAYTIGNTINPSLGANSPTSFDAGAYTFSNLLGNVDVSRNFNDLSFSFGTEIRTERFKVEAGQEESYINGGAQSFPGLQPSNALEETRNNIGVYAGLDWDATEKFLIGGAIRYENYSDFGDNFSWKVNARHLLGESIGAIRASVSTGFRAPSLHQIYLSNIQTLVSGGTVSNQGTFNNVSSVIRGLGVPALDAETALNFTAGITLRPANNFSLSLDYYNISVNDRVLFTGEVGFDGDDDTDNVVEQILVDNDITSIKFFVNALDTRTQGIDFVADYQRINIGNALLGLILSVNYNETDIEGAIDAPGTVGDAGYDIFNRKEQSRVTTARPNLKGLFGINFRSGKFNGIFNTTYFGEVKWQHATDPGKDQTFGAKVVNDLILGYEIFPDFNLNLTVNNLFNVYPDELDNKGDVVTDLGGRFRYPWEVNQFGFNGASWRVGVNYSF